MSDNINADKYECVAKTIPMTVANLVAVVLMLPLAVLCFYLYATTWKAIGVNTLSFVLSCMFLVGWHELTHGIVLGCFCKNKHKSIKYGFMSCHCKEVLTVSCYRLGVALPLFTAGLLPFIVNRKLFANVGKPFSGSYRCRW